MTNQIKSKPSLVDLIKVQQLSLMKLFRLLLDWISIRWVITNSAHHKMHVHQTFIMWYYNGIL